MSSKSGLTIGSLFSGVGALDLGLIRAGHGPVIWQVELDEICRLVLKQHWPMAQRYEDITALNNAELCSVDIISAGWPCQDLSRANSKGDGLDGSRSGLWRHALCIIARLCPTWVVVENVAHAANRWVDAVRGGLAEHGYESLPFTLEASFFGAPHRRPRVIIVAHAVSSAVWQQSGRGQGACGEAQAQLAELGTHEGWPAGLEVVASSDGAPSWMVRALGNLCMPQMGQVAGEVINLIRGRNA